MILGILFGLAFLAAGGDILVRGSVRLADYFGISRLLTGLVLVGFGTSVPELATSVSAALDGAPGIAVGNVVGSNIANILLILGIAAMVAPLRCDPRAFKRDGPMLVLATAAVIAAAASGEFGRPAGILFVSALGAYVLLVYFIERRTHDASARMHEEEAVLAGSSGLHVPALLRPWASIAITLAGMGLVLWGARLLVAGAVELARTLGVSEAVIGLTIVALGTSLPELATSVAAAFRRESDIAFGNIMGSCIFNLLGILGVTALVMPITLPPGLRVTDLWIMAAATILLLVFARTGFRLSRMEGGVFLVGYALFTALLVHRSLA